MSEDLNRRLIWAVREGNIETAERMIDAYGLSHCPGWSSGYVLLREALENDQETMAKMLLNRGSRVNSKNHKNTSVTPLHLAVQTGNTEIVAMLLDRGAIVNALDSGGRTPLFSAVSRGSLETVKLLLDRGAHVNTSTSNGSSPLSTAVKDDKLAIAEELLRHGANPNLRNPWTPLGPKYRQIKEQTPLHLAITRSNSPMIELLLKMGADVNGPSGQWDETPLHVATETSSDEIVRLLLAKGANVKATGRDDETPLHAAIKSRSRDKVKLLLEMGADVDASTKNGATALSIAAEKTEMSVIEEILRFRPDAKSEANRRSLLVAIRQTHAGDKSREIVDALLRYGFNVRAEDAEDVKLFHAAVEGGHRAIVESLLKFGVDANATLGSGKRETPLHAAIRCRRFEIVELLLSHGANANAEDEAGKSVMLLAIEKGVASVVKSLLVRSDASSRNIEELVFAAVKRGDPGMVEALLDSAPGVDVDGRDKVGRTPLHCVVSSDSLLRFFEEETGEGCAESLAKAKIAVMLVNRGASVNAVTKSGTTALHLAAMEGYEDVARVLLESKAHVDCPSDKGNTPLHMATNRGKTTIVKILLDHGANVNARTKLGATALHCASGKGHAELVNLLLKRGANPDFEDPQKRSALHYAVIKSHSDVVGALLRHGTNVTFKNLMTLLYYAKSQVEKFRRHYYNLSYDEYDEDCDDFREIPRHAIGNANCPWLQVVETLERHVVAMKALECRENHWNLPGFDMGYEHDLYLQSCRREIEKMKTNSIGGRNVSVLDVLTRDMNQLAVYARNESIAQALACQDLADEFPTYYGMAARRFQQGRKRVGLLSSGAKSLNALTSYVMPDLAIENILKHLSNGDLEKLIEACPDDFDS